MSTPSPQRFRRLLALAVLLACGGCGTDQGLKVNAAPDSAGTGTVTPAAPPPIVGPTPKVPSAPAKPGDVRKAAADAAASAKPAVPNLAASIRPDAQCNTPDENYDFTGVITLRFGTEGALRLRTLLSSDFKDAGILPKDRQMLNTLARELLWIPTAVEEQIGNLMFTFGGRDVETLSRSDGNDEYWDGTALLISKLLAAAPKTPFDTRLVLVTSGDPGSLAGGLVMLDAPTVKSVLDGNKNSARTKLNFILAHELAHIYKRHRAKRIQQLLVDSQSGLKLVRLIFNNVKQGKPDFSPSTIIQIGLMVPEVIDLVRKYQAKYEQDQEFEADGCATALMLSAGIGDPLAGFRTYRQDQRDQNKLAGEAAQWNPYVSHPPNEAREKNIQQRAAALTAQAIKDQAAAKVAARPVGPTGGPARRAAEVRSAPAPSVVASAPARTR